MLLRILKRLKIKDKLTIGYMFPLIIFLSFLTFWGFNFNKIRKTALNIKNNIIPKINLIVEIKDSFNHLVLDLQKFITIEDVSRIKEIDDSYKKYLETLQNYEISKDSENNLEKMYINELNENNIKINSVSKSLYKLIPERKEYIDKIENIEKKLEAFYNSKLIKYDSRYLDRLLLYFRDVHANIMSFGKKGYNSNEALEIKKEINKTEKDIDKTISKLFNVVKDNQDRSNITKWKNELFNTSINIIEINEEINNVTVSLLNIEDKIYTTFNYLLIYQRDIVNKGIIHGTTTVFSTIVQFILLFIILIPLSFFISRYLSNHIVNSIKKFSESTKIIAKGDLDHKIEIENYDEIGELSENFNIMAKELAIAKKNIVENILSSIPAFVVVFQSNNFKIEYINSELISIIPELDNSHKKSFYIGKNLFDVIPFMDKNKINDFLESSEKVIDKFEIKRGARLFELILFKISQEDEAGGLSGIIFNNITETKFYQEHILNNEKLITLGRAASGIAHEINNPLYVILSKSEEIAEMEESTPIIKDYANEIGDLIDYISNIIKDISQYSRSIRKGEYLNLNINDSINEAMNIAKYCFNFLEVDIKKELDDLPDFYAIRGELMQVFINIFNNAIQAMDAKGKLFIKSFYSNNKITVEIADTGRGIKKEDEKYIYDLFYTTKESDGGSGQGLHIVKKILDKYNAIIKFKSEEGKGTTFTLIFPAE